MSAPGAVFAALVRALPAMSSARIVAVVVAPLFAAGALWAGIGWFAWKPLTHWLGATLPGGNDGWNLYAGGAAAAALLMLAAVLTALVAVAVLAMPVIVATVARRDFPGLAERRGGTFAGSLVNAAVAVVVFLPLWLLALALLFLPPVYVAVSLCLNAWLNQRLFRYDALALHATGDEMREVIRGGRGRLLLLGLVLAPLSLVPVVNLLAPIYAGVAFTYLCLDELARLRARGAQPGAMDGG
jgi:CysZ protein